MIGIEEGDLIVSGTFVKKAVKKPAPKPAAPAAAPAAAEKKGHACRRNESGRTGSGGSARGTGCRTERRRQADPGPEQVHLLHHLCPQVPGRGPDGRSQGEDLEAGRGQVCRLRHMRRRLPEKRHRDLRRKAKTQKQIDPIKRISPTKEPAKAGSFCMSLCTAKTRLPCHPQPHLQSSCLPLPLAAVWGRCHEVTERTLQVDVQSRNSRRSFPSHPWPPCLKGAGTSAHTGDWGIRFIGAGCMDNIPQSASLMPLTAPFRQGGRIVAKTKLA